ncbi:MAG TPA: tRNA pseudouridine(38-40) synthase TruA [Candidatus Polarisedimenticolia bacterium]|nr:tRNA pseudouridine(38-40) synthase TruA [Candidatus Polarisedimenticolia bacterium]
MRNLRMTIAYVGTRFAGWQVQPGRETIQGILQDRIGAILEEPIRIEGAGRTDAGVHARGQVANFMTASRIPTEGLRRALNARLPEEIRVTAVAEAEAGFHARSDARGKEYRYTLFRGQVLSPFEAPFAVQVRGGFEVEPMRAAAGRLLGRHDFTSFASSHCRVIGRERTIVLSELRVDASGDFVEYRVRADGFLQHMVRTIAGTLVDVGRGRREAGDMTAILRARDRRAAGPCAPARGLVLERVFYGEDT